MFGLTCPSDPAAAGYKGECEDGDEAGQERTEHRGHQAADQRLEEAEDQDVPGETEGEGDQGRQSLDIIEESTEDVSGYAEGWDEDWSEESETEAAQGDEDTDDWEHQTDQTRPEETLEDVVIEPVQVTQDSFAQQTSVRLSLEVPPGL